MGLWPVSVNPMSNRTGQTFIFLFLLFISPYFALAQNPSITLSLHPPEVILGESTELKFTISGSSADILPYRSNPPNLAKSLASFKPVRRGRQHRIVNGRHSVTHGYTLTPQKLGTTTINPKTVPVNGKNIAVKPVTLKVLPRPKPQPGNNNEFGLPKKTEVFILIDMPETKLVPYQLSQATLELFVAMVRFQPANPELPTGLSASEWIQVGAPYVRTIGGIRYTVRKFRANVWADRKGTFILHPSMSGTVTRSVRGSPFGRNSKLNVPVGTKGKPLPVITVSDLPTTNRPESFENAVGEFNLKADIKAPDDLQVGDPIAVTMTVSGTGHLKRINPPTLDVDPNSPDFRVYEPRLADEKNLAKDGLSGTRSWEQVIEATSTNITELPPVRFSFYKPSVKRYIELEKGPFPITVKSDTADRIDVVRSSPRRGSGGRIVDQDLIFLKPLPSRWTNAAIKPWYLNPIFLAAQLLPLGLLAGTFFYTRRRNDLKQDVAKARRLQAPKAAKAGLAQAEAAIKNDDRSTFYEGVWTSLTDYFGNRLNLPPGAVSAAAVAAAFPHQADSARELFEACETQRFGGGNDDDADFHLKQLKDLLRDCEKEKT